MMNLENQAKQGNGFTIVFGHVWAIWWWRHTHIRAKADDLRTTAKLGLAPATKGELKVAGVYDLRQKCLDCGFPKALSVDLLSADTIPRGRTRNVKVRTWNAHVPAGAICAAAGHLVASPEFCFVLIACDIRRICQEQVVPWQRVVVLAELGCELCGTYSKQNNARGFKNRDAQLTTAGQMRDFACAVAHERGARLAYGALRWVIDGLNSPMETAVYLMLCLPQTWGGLALPRPWSNVRLDVPEHLWKKTRQRQIIPDLCWVEYGLIVEFFGEDFHLNRAREDSERLEIEQDMGYKVVTFWKEDVTNLDRFNAKAASVASYLGKRLPEYSADFGTLQATLQKMLVKHQRWI